MGGWVDRSRLSFVIGLAGLCAIAASAAAELRVFEGEYVVEPPQTRSASGQAALSRSGISVVRSLGATAQLVKPTAALARSAAAGVAARSVPFDPADTFCKDLIKAGLAKSCSPNFEIRTSAVPNDPRMGEVWGLAAEGGIDAPGAWDYSTGSEQTVVAVIDTGIDYNHPDLRDNLWTNPGEIPGNGIDDDRNGYIDDVYGMSALDSSGNPIDENGHGTHVAGTIGARGNNGVGVAGVNWRVKIMACKFLNGSGSGSLAGAVEAINYMVMMKRRGIDVRVANNSWGGGGFSQSLYDAIREARDAGILFVAAAGNEANNNDALHSYPSDYELSNVVSVAAIGRSRTLASFSNYGAQMVDIAAPGVSILSTYPGASYRSLSGTSMAAPHVTGALALLLSAHPALTMEEAQARLYEAATPVDALVGKVRTGRVLNLARLLSGQGDPIASPNPQPEPSCSYSLEQISYAPDYSADAQPIEIQADELGFKDVALPFSVPFFDKMVNTLSVSPNGVIYLQGAPQSMDYQNSAAAPLYSIAALHADLSASVDPYGVRIYVGAASVNVYWLAKLYGSQTHGDIAVRTAIFSDGRIESFVSIPDPATAAVVARAATVGISGGEAASAVTFAYNSPAITDGLAVRYVPNCSDNSGGSSSVQVSAISLRGVNRRGQEVDRAVPGYELRIELAGRGTGETMLSISLDGVACAGSVPTVLNDGYALRTTRLPRGFSRYRTLQIAAEGGTVAARLKIKRKTTTDRVSSREFNSDCSAILKRLGR